MQDLRQKVENAAKLLSGISKDEAEDDHEGNKPDAKHQQNSWGD
jgi:hypothetical protein